MSVKIGLDVDGCAYDFVGSLRKYLISHPEIESDSVMPDATTWNFFSADWGMSKEEYLRHLVEGVNSGNVFWKGDVYPHCVDVISSLYRQGYQIKFITSRAVDGIKIDPKEITKYWLSSHGIPFHDVIVADDKTLAEHDIDILFDDAPGHLTARYTLGLPVVAFHQTWNSHIKEVDRVYGWRNLQEYIKENLPI